MQRYSTKHFWRMKESEQGEFVRYEDSKQVIDDYIAQEQLMYEHYKEEQARKWEERRLVVHLRDRVNAMFCVTMVMMGLAVGKLIGWSLGL
jgi:type IV secretory pathway component VirB8